MSGEVMSDIMRKILTEGTTPIMTDEGMMSVFNFYYDRCQRKLELGRFQYKGDGYGGGPSRELRLSTNKPRIDDESYDQTSIESSTDEALRSMYGGAYSGLHDDFPFGRFDDKRNASGAEYDVRIYINAPFGEIRYQFISLYAKKCKEKGIPCGAKFFEKKQTSKGSDNMILYSSYENLEKNLEILEEIKTELEEFSKRCGSPIATGMNYSYYAISHAGDMGSTYNGWFNNLSSKAFCFAMVEMIKEDEAFYATLTEQERGIIEYLSNPDTLKKAVKKNKVKDRDSVMPHAFERLGLGPEGVQIAKGILEKYVETNPELPKEIVISKLRSYIETIASLSNFGDTEHKELPISMRESGYEAMHIDPSEVKTQEPKIKVGKDRYLDLLKADKARVRYELARLGMKHDIQGKTDQELRDMLFDKIELDDEGLIDVLSGESKQLREFMGALGVKEEFESRSECEEYLIEMMGVDRVIDAAYSVRDQDAQLGRSRKWKFKDSLRTVRLARGQAIYDSEEFKALKTKEERRAFIAKYSPHAKEDVEEYHDLYRNGLIHTT